MKKWFTSDLHFGHKNICKFTDRNLFTDEEKHDQWLTDTWNKQVQNGDLVYVLGDVSFAKKYETVAETLSNLNGQKIFLKGNHDKREWFDALVKDGLIAAWYDYKEIKIADTSTCLFHFPISSWHKQCHGSWCIHGHSHGGHTEGKGYILDVGIDNAYKILGEHRFFCEETVVQYMQTRSKFVADLHRNNL